MKIRKATINDLEELTKIEAECFPAAEAATEESFHGRLRDDRCECFCSTYIGSSQGVIWLKWGAFR